MRKIILENENHGVLIIKKATLSAEDIMDIHLSDLQEIKSIFLSQLSDTTDEEDLTKSLIICLNIIHEKSKS
jgi:hypothetical protein